jgi:L-ribulokinase
VSYSVGIDFGTESGRAVVVDVQDGREVATAVSDYASGVITPEHEWALQDPADYLQVLSDAVPAAVRAAGIDPTEVTGVGIDFTSCTMLPTTADGTPLCFIDELRDEPHAWVKLWKHHAAQPEADRINMVAERRGEPWLARYGGKYSAEWFFSKALQILDEAPEVYNRADRLVEAADWLVWQLTGVETRNNTTAGYKAMWSPRDGFPSREFFGALDPRFAGVVDDKLSRTIEPVGSRAGGLCERMAALTGLPQGTPVAVANVDAHVSVPAVGVTKPGTMVIIMGTSNCHVLLGDTLAEVEGMCGVVEDGVLPGLYGYEAGQSGVGDIFAWFVDTLAPAGHDALVADAALLAPGESGLLALDWWNGNRSILVDADLTGVIVGLTLSTRPAEIYRALLEATAFGTRAIVEAFETAGVPVDDIVVCGGLPQKNPLLMQIYADVTGRPFSVASSTQAPALGAAMSAAVAAGVYGSLAEASAAMAPPSRTRFEPLEADHRVYSDLYAEYLRLHDLFGRDGDSVVKRLRSIRSRGGALTRSG